MNLAPASAAPFTTASIWAGRSESPGRTGAISTPEGTPRSLSRFTASRRLRGCDVPGSERDHTSGSRVPIEKSTVTSVTLAASASSSRSLSTNGDLVRIENGLRRSTRTSMIPRVSLYLPSAAW